MSVPISPELIIAIVSAATKLIIVLQPLISDYIKNIQDPEELKKLDKVKLLLSDAGLTEALKEIDDQIAEREKDLGL